MKKTAQAYDRKKWPDYDAYQRKRHDKAVELARRLVKEHYSKQRPWGLKFDNGRFANSQDKIDDAMTHHAIIRGGKNILRQRRGVCHDLAAARLKMLGDRGIDAHRLFVDFGDIPGNDGDHNLGHSMVFFRGDDGRLHMASPHMNDNPQNSFGSFDDIKDAVTQYIAAMKDGRRLSDDDFVEIHDTTEVPFKDIETWNNYRKKALKGKLLFRQKKAGARDFSGLLKLAYHGRTGLLAEWLSRGSNGRFRTHHTPREELLKELYTLKDYVDIPEARQKLLDFLSSNNIKSEHALSQLTGDPALAKKLFAAAKQATPSSTRSFPSIPRPEDIEEYKQRLISRRKHAIDEIYDGDTLDSMERRGVIPFAFDGVRRDPFDLPKHVERDRQNLLRRAKPSSDTPEPLATIDYYKSIAQERLRNSLPFIRTSYALSQRIPVPEDKINDQQFIQKLVKDYLSEHFNEFNLPQRFKSGPYDIEKLKQAMLDNLDVSSGISSVTHPGYSATTHFSQGFGNPSINVNVLKGKHAGKPVYFLSGNGIRHEFGHILDLEGVPNSRRPQTIRSEIRANNIAGIGNKGITPWTETYLIDHTGPSKKVPEIGMPANKYLHWFLSTHPDRTIKPNLPK